MMNKILKISLSIIFIFAFLLCISLISNADSSQGSIIVDGDDIIYRILPGTSVESFCDQLGLTLETPDTGDMPISSIIYSIHDKDYNNVTSGIIKTGMMLARGGSVMTTYRPLSVIGDVTGDGLANQIDLGNIIRHYIGLQGKVFTKPEQLKSADINNDGNINTIDFTNVIRYIITDGDTNFIITEQEKEKINTPPEPQQYQLSLNLKYYESMISEFDEQYDENAYINTTNVIIDGNKYDLTNAEVRTFKPANFAIDIKEYEKSYTLTVREGSLIAITTNNTSDTIWNYNNSKISESEYVYLQMPSKNASLNIENKMTTEVDNLQNGTAMIDNSVREMTGNVLSNLTGVKELDLTITKYGGLSIFNSNNLGDGTAIADLYPSTSNEEIAKSTVVRINGIKYDLTNASVNDISIPEETTPISYTKTYKIFVKPGDEVIITTNNSDDTTWKYNGTTIKNGVYATFNMPNSGASLTISNDYSLVSTGIGFHKKIVIDDNVRLINGTTGLTIR